MDWLDYREKLGIGFCDKDRFRYFLSKMKNELEGIKIYSDFFGISLSEYKSFCDITGAYLNLENREDDQYDGIKRYDSCLNYILRSESLNQFLAYYIAFVNSLSTDKIYENFSKRALFVDIIKEKLESSHISYDLIQEKEEFFIFPKGAKELDDELVSAPLDWLSDYPDSRKAFVKALKSYSDNEDEDASEVADKFRKALECFFQEFFGKEKTLENLKSVYGEYLKEQGVPKEIAGNFETILQSYTLYMNAYAKHHDKADKNALEYIMYQTGNIIRLLISLKRGEEENAD